MATGTGKMCEAPSPVSTSSPKAPHAYHCPKATTNSHQAISISYLHLSHTATSATRSLHIIIYIYVIICFVICRIHIYEKNDTSPSILEEFDFPVETPASPHDIDLFKRLLYINPFLKLPASNPKIYDNQPSLISNIELNLRRPFCDKVESRGILYILFSRFLKRAVAKADTSDSRILQAVAYIRRHLNVPLDVNILAHDACMSKDHFIRVFRQETGDTPKAYVIKKKMESAEQFIVTSDRPIKEIARMVGYDDCSHFNKAFKAFAGVTPATYREQHRE